MTISTSNKKATKLKNKHLGIAFLTAEIDVDSNEIQLTPHGKFKARDGRPTSCGHWNIDSNIAKGVIASLSKRINDIVIDYEHQTLKTEINGQPADAAGWFRGGNVIYRDGIGLFATKVEWTDEAKERIRTKKYRYISPVIIYDKRNGTILDIYNAALTNDPAIDGMNDVTLAAASNLIFTQLTNNKGDPAMDEILELLRKLLGLPADATEEDILAALQEIDASVSEDAASNLVALLQGKDTQVTELTNQVTALTTSIAALKAKKTGSVDPAKYVPIAAVEQLTNELAEVKKQIQGDKVQIAVEEALTNGKLLPALKEWAVDLGNKDFEALSNYLLKAPTVDALSNTQTGGKPPANNYGLTDSELEAAKLTGLTPEEYLKAKKEMK